VGSDEVIVLDTHIWVWFHNGNNRLSPAVASQICSDTVISVASVWEVILLIEKGRLQSTMSPDNTVRRWLEVAPMRVAPIDTEIVTLSRSLQFNHDDPADRFIAATAFHFSAPLATVDARLSGLPWLKTIS